MQLLSIILPKYYTSMRLKMATHSIYWQELFAYSDGIDAVSFKNMYPITFSNNSNKSGPTLLMFGIKNSHFILFIMLTPSENV